MSKLFRLLSILVVLSFLIAGCGGQPAAPAESVAPPAAATEESVVEEPPTPPEATEAPVTTEEPVEAPVEAQCLKIGLSISSGETNSLDPFAIPTTEQAVMINQVYNRLLDLDNNFVVSPELAESWESNEDATEWTFHLRSGVKFSDGKELTAKDVVYSYQRLVNPDDPSEALSSLSFLKPEGITAVDDYTVKFTTEKPVSELPVLITVKNAWIVQDGATKEQLRLNGIGTGPFIPVDFQPVQQPHKFVKESRVLGRRLAKIRMPGILCHSGANHSYCLNQVGRS